MGLISTIRSRTDRWFAAPGRKTYSQCGEDLICAHLLEHFLAIESPRYIDIGANDPTHLNNTYLFYERGSSGILIEPDPRLCEVLRRRRPRDSCLNIGVGNETRKATLYMFNPPTLNTFSAEEAAAYQKRGFTCSGEASIHLKSMGAVISDHCGTRINFVSLDAEGFDEVILKSWDFNSCKPEVFCVETVDYSTQEKSTAVLTLMSEAGYRVYADTHLNTIFVEVTAWTRAMERWRGRG